MNKENLRILYVMPRSMGDVLQSTAICKRIKEKYSDCELHFGVEEQYKDLVEGCPWIDSIRQYDPRMDNPEFINQYYDITYTPHLYTQYLHTSNWIHKGHTDRNIVEHFLWHSDLPVNEETKYLKPEEFYTPGDKNEKTEIEGNYIVIVSNSNHQMKTKRYKWWKDVIVNLQKIMPEDFKIVQCGTPNDELLNDDVIDMRGQTTIPELNYIIKNSKLVLTVDSYPSHVAKVLCVPVLSLFGSSYIEQSGPIYVLPGSVHCFMQADFSEGCNYACYKNECKVGNKCIDSIDSEIIFNEICEILQIKKPDEFKFKKYFPEISGYITLYNAVDAKLPFIESIKSMLGFCDEVIVVDGESTDNTKRILGENFEEDERITIYTKEFDWDTPGIDGEQKAFARALCTKDFCWQQDADECVHENDYDKIRELVRNFPDDALIMHLPVIDYFNGNNISTDYHCWKWRLSRNHPNLTHGISKTCQIKDEKTGKIYAKEGMSDGCEYIDMVRQDPIPHFGFYERELDILRKEDPEEYGRRINEIFKKLPSVHHYSWYDLKRKIQHFKSFWDRGWSNLYNTNPPPRFTDDIEIEIKKLVENGGCHEGGEIISVEKTQPKLMKEWIDKNK